MHFCEFNLVLGAEILTIHIIFNISGTKFSPNRKDVCSVIVVLQDY